MGLTLLASFGCVLLLFLDVVNSVSNRRCFPLYDGRSLCFTRPNPSVNLSWSDAQQWCSNIGATLPIPHTYDLQPVYANVLGYFGLRSKTMWLGANSTFDINDWYWSNGTRFNGTIDNGNSSLKTHAYIIRNGTDIKFVAANPRTESAGSICQPSYLNNNEWECARAWNSFWSHGKCYTKSKYQYRWSDHAFECGGIQKLDLTDLTQWIDDQTKFWIGLRCTWWSWQDVVSGTSFELTETSFSYNFPNNTSPECLASHSDPDDERVNWKNRNCSTDLPFICQQYVSPTTTTRTMMSTTGTTRRHGSTNANMSAQLNNSTPGAMDTNTVNLDKYGRIVLLVFGLFGGLFLAVIVWLATLTARVNKNHRYLQKSGQSNYSNPCEISPFDDAHALKEVPSSAIDGPEKSFEDQRM